MMVNEIGETRQVGDQQVAPATRSALPADALIVVPVRNMVLFPGTVLPITIGRPRSSRPLNRRCASSAKSVF